MTTYLARTLIAQIAQAALSMLWIEPAKPKVTPQQGRGSQHEMPWSASPVLNLAIFPFAHNHAHEHDGVARYIDCFN